jgi:hypothetical protein
MIDTTSPDKGAQKSCAHKACKEPPITQSFADDVVVNAKELAHALRVSRWTVARWREEGYQFEFGNRSTPGHLKAWLRERAGRGEPQRNELAIKLASLR